MGEVEIRYDSGRIIIRSHIVTYGTAANPELTERIRKEIDEMWNAPRGYAFIGGQHFDVQFQITSDCKPSIDQIEVLSNTDPRNNYFRIEDFVHGDISFVDGVGSNTGYFKTENLFTGSTTAAHEYGHTIGLDHPPHLDVRGEGRPGIMYPRGTLVDPMFQYDPSKPAGVTGGTMHPMHRVVKQEDFDELQLHRLFFQNNRAIIGKFTSVYHWNHADLNAPDRGRQR